MSTFFSAEICFKIFLSLPYLQCQFKFPCVLLKNYFGDYSSVRGFFGFKQNLLMANILGEIWKLITQLSGHKVKPKFLNFLRYLISSILLDLKNISTWNPPKTTLMKINPHVTVKINHSGAACCAFKIIVKVGRFAFWRFTLILNLSFITLIFMWCIIKTVLIRMERYSNSNKM